MTLETAMGTRWARVIRGLVASGVATLVAALSHFLAGGGVPNAASIAVILTFSALVSIALTGRRLSLLRMSLAVVVSQFAFHALFATIGGATGSVVHSGGHAMHGVIEVAPTVGHHTSAAMWFAHALAAAATIVVLRRGEAAFWSLRTAALRFLVVAFAVARVVAAPSTPPIHAEVTPRRLFLIGSLQLRGPPVVSI